jgi:hypothetical protein
MEFAAAASAGSAAAGVGGGEDAASGGGNENDPQPSLPLYSTPSAASASVAANPISSPDYWTEPVLQQELVSLLGDTARPGDTNMDGVGTSAPGDTMFWG